MSTLAKKIETAPRWIRILIPTLFIVIWLAISGIGGPYFGRIDEVSTNNLTDFLPKSSESAQVQERLGDFSAADTIPAILIFSRDSGLTADDKTYLSDLREEIIGIEGIKEGVSPSILSADGEAAEIIVPIDTNSEIKDTTEAVREAVADSAPEGLNHYVTGPAGFSSDLSAAFAGIDGLLLGVALAVVFVILLVVYRSPLLPLIVLSTSVFALSASILLVWWLAKEGVVQLNGQVQGILFILVIGAATDYSLLYVARYREELQRHQSKWKATHRALRGSIEPILASGGTVIVGLLCLLLSDLDSNKALGPVGGIGIAMSMLAALTFLPSILFAAGRKVFWPFQPKYDEAFAKDKNHMPRGIWTKVARFVDRHARAVWIGSFIVLAIAVLGIFQLRASGVEQNEIILGESQARDGQREIAQHFPAGSGSPALIIGSADKFDELVDASLIDGVDSVMAAAKNSPSGMIPVGDKAASFGPFAGIKPTEVNGDVMLRATLADTPDSVEAEETIVALRNSLQAVDGSALVGGATATALDTNDTSIRDRTLIIPVILGAILLILIVLLRSLVAPILLIATTAISFAASLGVAAIVFNVFLGFPGADASVPLYAFVFLVALGIDYNIFLMTRVREETLKYGTRQGTVRGLAVTGGVITSAGIVLAATFAALSVIPILFLVQLAFIVAFGVLLDTLLVRSLFVPGLIIDLDRRSWWPSKLSKK